MTKSEFLSGLRELVRKMEGVNFVYVGVDTLIKQTTQILKGPGDKAAARGPGPDKAAGDIMLSAVGGKLEQDKT